MNLRPSGYEPDELPDCSTPRYLRSLRSGAHLLYTMRKGMSSIFLNFFCSQEQDRIRAAMSRLRAEETAGLLVPPRRNHNSGKGQPQGLWSSKPTARGKRKEPGANPIVVPGSFGGVREI